jgi:hypothetical protein
VCFLFSFKVWVFFPLFFLVYEFCYIPSVLTLVCMCMCCPLQGVYGAPILFAYSLAK